MKSRKKKQNKIWTSHSCLENLRYFPIFSPTHNEWRICLFIYGTRIYRTNMLKMYAYAILISAYFFFQFCRQAWKIHCNEFHRLELCWDRRKMQLLQSIQGISAENLLLSVVVSFRIFKLHLVVSIGNLQRLIRFSHYKINKFPVKKYSEQFAVNKCVFSISFICCCLWYSFYECIFEWR